MAAMTSPSQQPVTAPKPRRDPLQIRTPLPLSASQESQVRELYHQRVRSKCADEIKEFAACVNNRTVSVAWMCRGQKRAMNECMLQYTTQEEQDAARTEWFATIKDRQEERAKKEEKRVKDEKFWVEWWDKDLSKTPGQGPAEDIKK